jgi:cell division protein FtsA
VLDIGTSKIVALVALASGNNDIKIIGSAIQLASGFKSGIVTDLKMAEHSVIKTIEEAEKSSGERIDKIVVSVCNNNINSSIIKSSVPIHANSPINSRDIGRVIRQGLEQFKKDNQDIIHYFPLEYDIDGQNGIKDPLSMYGKELTTHIHLISTPTGSIINLANCIARCHIDVEDFILSSYASAVSCLNEDDKSLGSILIDIGATITSFSIYDNNNFIFTDTIPVGGSNITSDISQCFSLNFKQAERIKILYGNVISTSMDEHETIEFSDNKDNSFENKVIKVRHLSNVIKPRTEEIFEMIIAKLKKAGIWKYRPRRIILTGGTSQLQGIKDLASYTLGGQVRVGAPKPISGLSSEYKGPAFSTAIGMIRIINDNLIKSDLLVDNEKGFFAKLFKWF